MGGAVYSSVVVQYVHGKATKQAASTTNKPLFLQQLPDPGMRSIKGYGFFFFFFWLKDLQKEGGFEIWVKGGAEFSLEL